ncbi:MAG TPA: exopolysaccharide biosynthesis protein [Solirubrobacteraceae bacterium]|jgi:hypothetical protein|nr:exopolysaccharide biosynthesis protein [Solirubrobacteraceae bacterium]
MKPLPTHVESPSAAGDHRALQPPGGGTPSTVHAEMARSSQPAAPGPHVDAEKPSPAAEKISDELERWQKSAGEKTLDTLIELFHERSFAILFVLLLGVAALPLPTGGATHVFEIIAVLLALQLVAGRDEIWLPQRWRKLELAGAKQQRLISGLMKTIRWLERFSRPRLRFLFAPPLSNIVFGLVVIGGSVGAFFAPPFSGLDTLPALGIVLLSLGVLLKDVVVVVVALSIGVAGVVLEIALASAAINGIGQVF